MSPSSIAKKLNISTRLVARHLRNSSSLLAKLTSCKTTYLYTPSENAFACEFSCALAECRKSVLFLLIVLLAATSTPNSTQRLSAQSIHILGGMPTFQNAPQSTLQTQHYGLGYDESFHKISLLSRYLISTNCFLAK